MNDQVDVQALAKQFQGASLAKLVEKHMRSMTQEQLVSATKTTLNNFPQKFRDDAMKFSVDYPAEHWIEQKQIVNADLSALFVATLHDGKDFAANCDIDLSDQQAFHLFKEALNNSSNWGSQH